jgi:hypothetical protein
MLLNTKKSMPDVDVLGPILLLRSAHHRLDAGGQVVHVPELIVLLDAGERRDRRGGLSSSADSSMENLS